MQCNLPILTEDQLFQLQSAVRINDPKYKLNYSKLSETLGIPVGNTVFRKFLNNKGSSIGASNFHKILEFFDYDVEIIPVIKDSSNHKKLLEIKKESIDNISHELDNFSKTFMKETGRDKVKKKKEELSNKHLISDILLSLDADDMQNEILLNEEIEDIDPKVRRQQLMDDLN